jgi:predicted SprT family Zn-dependent metalloprotease
MKNKLYFNETSVTTLREITELANDLLNTTWNVQVYRSEDAKQINLADKGWTFVFDGGKTRFGCCKPGRKTISVSRSIATLNLDKAMKIEDTIRHELAHALQYEGYGYSSHDRAWQIIAKSVGSNGERCYNAEKEGIKHEQAKYTAYCETEGCDNSVDYHRKPTKILKGRSACGSCCNKYNNGRFSHEYVLKVRQNY